MRQHGGGVPCRLYFLIGFKCCIAHPPLPLPQDALALDVYQQLLVVAIALAALAATHLLVLAIWRWQWSDGRRPLPALLVFPRIEIILATTTIMGVSEAFGTLVATHNTVPEAISILAVLYVLFFMLTVAFLAYMLAKHSALLPDKSEVS